MADISNLKAHLQKQAGVAGWLVNQSPWGSDIKGTFTWVQNTLELTNTLRFCLLPKKKLTKSWTDPAQSWTSESLACSTSQFWKVPTRAVLLREKRLTQIYIKKNKQLTCSLGRGKWHLVPRKSRTDWQGSLPQGDTANTHQEGFPCKIKTFEDKIMFLFGKLEVYCQNFGDGISWNAKALNRQSDNERILWIWAVWP